MDEFNNIIAIADTAIARHPALKDDIAELARLAIAEIQDGESADNEVELLMTSIDDLVEERLLDRIQEGLRD